MEVSTQSTAVPIEDFEGELVIDEGKKPVKSQKRKTNGEKVSPKATSSAAVVDIPSASTPRAVASQPEPVGANEPEVTSRSGRKIKPKR